MGDREGRSKLHGFLRCVGHMYERAQKAEAAAQHWQLQWDHAFGHGMVQRKQLQDASETSQGALLSLGSELAAVRAERDRLLQELWDMRETIRASSLAHHAHE